ncbi:SDR family oxidoreductase [Stratiformator vulcanicus]|uniref:3-oxoacyl-[acyl-carrier-protein] reductase FabG n=1 Tax=Stratiformator vulcanicus TaxID=2527980 RepID=A0A517R5Z2_9PLAN|nr:SDR family oxidoreductase [Stratiformator vulcanicus]QDT39291.1 3-oxoacyl-[acyl-carrier-protein] reductase FabG [Stratiformator vulcanicus]
MNLDGKTCVVTGAAVRIGRSIALGAGRAGANVVVHYGTSKDEAEETAAELREFGVGALTISADLNDSVATAEAIFDAARDAFGPIDVLVNSAAIFENAPLVETTEDLYDRHQNINLKSPFFLAQQFVKQLPGDRRGHILNLADWRSRRIPPDFIAYTLAKAGLAAMTEGLAQQLAPRVQVNAIAPGAILPPPGSDPEEWKSRKVPEIPLGRTGGPDDIAAAALYLLQSDFISGEILHVTGAEHLSGP